MKKIFSIAVVAVLALQCSVAFAQRPHHERDCEDARGEGRPEITELVSDLSSGQKSKLEFITKESRNRVERLRKEQKSVRDSIGRFMDMEGDHSKQLYPLFDREARLQAEISREMYATKVRFDEVLTPVQRKELMASRKKHQHGDKGVRRPKKK